MHPIVCLDRGFSSRFDTEFGWLSKGIEFQVDHSDQLKSGLRYLAGQAREGAWVVFTLNYEAAFHLMDLPKHVAETQPSKTYLKAYIYSEAPQPIAVDQAPATQFPHWETPDFAHYRNAFKQIQDAIQAGVCYQVNHTFRLYGQSDIPPWDLYRTLLETQPANYGAFIDFKEHQVLSRSPELFVEKRGDHLRSEPMKGTAARDSDEGKDQFILEQLLSDTKMQAENLMIVDLIRNDLSRVSKPHSVQVSRLFEPRSLKSVHQVSSVIESTLQSKVDSSQLIEALFPCGSVVGAPKAKAFELIQKLEPDQRELYTGSVGFLEPSGDMTLSVAIRTVEQSGSRVQLGLGSGLVADSSLEEEWNECLLKGCFCGVDNSCN